MKHLLLCIAASFLLASDCNKKKDPSATGDVPACVQQLIDEAAKATPPTTPVRVDEYTYKGEKVYLFTADCCDFYNILYDESCKKICAPSGGFTGGGDGKCPDFDSTAKQVKTIWKKPTK